jgi:hypothetical protein
VPRNSADRALAHNVRATFTCRLMRTYRARRRWGSVLGVQPDGLEVFAPATALLSYPKLVAEELRGETGYLTNYSSCFLLHSSRSVTDRLTKAPKTWSA